MTPLVAITGATGFLGYHVAKTLFRKGYRLRLLVRKEPHLDFGDAGPAVELVRGELSDIRALNELVVGADVVIHMAGLIKAPRRSDFGVVNAQGTETLVKAIRDANPEGKFIFVSSMAAREPSLSAYAASKAKAEEIVRENMEDALVLRPSAIYGPGDRETLLLFKACQLYFQPALNHAQARLCVVHVGDVAEMITQCCETKLAGNSLSGIYEVTDEKTAGYSWEELIREACRATGSAARPFIMPSSFIKALGQLGNLHATLTGSAKMLSGDKVNEILHANWGSSRKAQISQDIWKPRWTLQSGFKETVAWYRGNNWLS